MKFPATKEELEAAGYLFDNDAKCRACGADMEWWITPNGKKMPMVVKEIRPGGLMTPVQKLVRDPHFADCPAWKKK
jgi:hypothetical protein